MRELKPRYYLIRQFKKESHPLRVRELKLESRVYNAANVASHPLRVRELKREDLINRVTSQIRRTLYGCVN